MTYEDTQNGSREAGPKLYVDGFEMGSVGGPGYSFWAGGGAGGAGSRQDIGIWGGNGPGSRSYSMSRGALLDAGTLFEKVEAYKTVSGKEYSNTYADVKGTSNAGGVIIVEQLSTNQKVDAAAGINGVCGDCLDPSTVGKNTWGLTYPGSNNPRSYNRNYNYSYVPTNLAEYPAIGHDRRYDNLHN